MNFKVTPWVIVDEYCAARVREGGDVNKIEDRVAFIEKTPRVRIRPAHLGNHQDHLNWCEGRHFKGDDCFDEEARAWCDRMLKELGYEV